VGPVIVQRPSLSEALLRTVAGLGLAMGVTLSVGLALASGPIAAFYSDPSVAPIVIALATTFTLAAFGMVPEGLLQRELRFRRLAGIELTITGFNSVMVLSLALSGFGVWALVWSSIAVAGVRSLLLVISSSWRFRIGFSPQAVKGAVGFGANVMGFNLIQYLVRNVDRLIIGRQLGALQLGYYDYAYRFYMYPLQVITNVLISIMFPVLSRLQDNLAEMGSAFLRANGAIALLTFPMMAGLAAVADPFVRVVLGDQWIPVIPLVQILAPLGALQSITATPGQIFLATGRAALRLWWSVIYSTLILASFFAGLPWGILGVASAYTIVMVPIAVVAFWLALRLVELPLSALWWTVWRSVTASVVMGGSVALLARAMQASDIPDALVLAASVPVGVVIYVGITWLLPPDALSDIHRLLPQAIRRNPIVARFFSSALGERAEVS
jgi:PST family polysaccharide transporter